MAKTQERHKALEMRKRGKSIPQIARVLEVSKSTVSVWCKDIHLSYSQRKNLKEKQKKEGAKFLRKAALLKKQNYQNDVAKAGEIGTADVGKLSPRDLHMIGLGLYWGEGYKKGNNEFGFTNSDPNSICFIIKWLQEIYKIPLSQMKFRISINYVHKGRAKEVMQYWLMITGADENQFTKTSFIKAKNKKIYKNKRNHFGTLRVKVNKGSLTRARILGSLDMVTKSVEDIS